MGYTTDFSGIFAVTPTLKPEHLAYLQKFNDTRRMKRDAKLAGERPDPLRTAAGLPIGEEGKFFVGADGFAGQDRTAEVLNYNSPPAGQPGLWCQWRPTDDGNGIEWDGGEKFYHYTEWLSYLIDTFLKPWGYTVNGEVQWAGEDSSDRGVLIVKDNRVGEAGYEVNRKKVRWN